MKTLHWYTATVIDNNDTDKQGKIKVRLIPENKDVDESLLPWVLPFHTPGMSNQAFSFHPPQNNDQIWVVYLDPPFFKEGYYFTGDFIRGFFSYGTITNLLSSISELTDTTYPKLMFELFPNGNLIFQHLVNGDVGIYHKSGTYSIIDQNGKVIVNTGSQGAIIKNNAGSIELKSTGEVDINGGNLKVLV